MSQKHNPKQLTVFQFLNADFEVQKKKDSTLEMARAANSPVFGPSAKGFETGR